MKRKNEDATKVIGQNLKLLRKNRGLCQTKFGGLFGAAKQTISSYENGKSEPSAATLKEFADYFGVPMERFFHPTK